ncbi:MAG: dienelactone hydrolase family protein [Pseudomonadota bacterium]|nr:dienelactone hydrolase family protein [Pseudomonadota bacterium]
MKAYLIALTLLLTGCAQIGTYSPNKGGLEVAINSDIELSRQSDKTPLKIRAVYPVAEGRYPLIVLSHGTFSNNQRYDLVAKYWASNGYMVLIPEHIDANYAVMPKSVADMVNIIGTRVEDMSQILDELELIKNQAPALKNKIIKNKIIAAGHSVGSLVAMRVTGLKIYEINTKKTISNDENRFDVLVMLNDPGKQRSMPISAWYGSTVPTFMSTGTDDYGLMGSREEPKEANQILSANKSVDRYQLLLQKGDHYFGGLVQKEVKAEPDYEGLELFNENSTAFMDAYIKGNKNALRYLQNIDMQAETNLRAELIREFAQN